MRLRGPWCVCGTGIETSVSSQSGTILGGWTVNLVMNPMTFFPDMLHRRLANFVNIVVRLDFIFGVDADLPKLSLYNPPGAGAPYAAEWRHINP